MQHSDIFIAGSKEKSKEFGKEFQRVHVMSDCKKVMARQVRN